MSTNAPQGSKWETEMPADLAEEAKKRPKRKKRFMQVNGIDIKKKKRSMKIANVNSFLFGSVTLAMAIRS